MSDNDVFLNWLHTPEYRVSIYDEDFDKKDNTITDFNDANSIDGNSFPISIPISNELSTTAQSKRPPFQIHQVREYISSIPMPVFKITNMGKVESNTQIKIRRFECLYSREVIKPFVLSDHIGPLSKKERNSKLMKYYVKKMNRKNNCNSYPVRRLAALSRLRCKGKFISAKTIAESATLLGGSIPQKKCLVISD